MLSGKIILLKCYVSFQLPDYRLQKKVWPMLKSSKGANNIVVNIVLSDMQYTTE